MLQLQYISKVFIRSCTSMIALLVHFILSNVMLLISERCAFALDSDANNLNSLLFYSPYIQNSPKVAWISPLAIFHINMSHRSSTDCLRPAELHLGCEIWSR